MRILILACLLSLFSFNIFSQSLIAHYKFDGNIADSSMNLNHATFISGSFCPDRYGFPNHALRLNSTVDRVRIDSDPSLNLNQLNSFTASMWMKRRTFDYQNYNPVLFTVGENTLNYTLMVDAEFFNNVPSPQYRDQLVFTNYSVNAPLDFIIGDPTISDTLWHQITIVVDQVQAKVHTYYDGAFVKTNVYAYHPLNDFTLSIGNHRTLNWSFLGDIDDFKLYNDELTQIEILELVEANEPIQPDKISISPTVCDQSLNISSTNSDLKLTVHLIDALGRVQFNQSLITPTAFSTGGLAAGVYFVKIYKNDMLIQSEQIIISH